MEAIAYTYDACESCDTCQITAKPANHRQLRAYMNE